MFDEHVSSTSGNPTAQHGAITGVNLDATESEHRFFEFPGFVDFGGKAEVLHAGGIE